jgi:hypothetical protein
MDITIRLFEKVVHRDINGLYQTKEIGIEFTEPDVPAEKVRERKLALRLEAKKYIVNTKLLEGLITPEQGIEEVKRYERVSDAK